MKKEIVPVALTEMFANPGKYESQLKNYLKEAGYTVDAVTKTIGRMELYHFRTLAALNAQSFFTGNYDNLQTNVPSSSFIRPKGEHMIIYAIKFEEGVSATSFNVDWLPGAQNGFTKNLNLTFELNGKVQLQSLPLASSLENLTTADAGLIWLDEPIIWGGEISAKITLAAKDPLNVGPVNTWGRVTLMGVGLFS